MTPRLLCRLDELAEFGSKAFSIGQGDWPLRGFVVQRGAEVFAYLNRCPHAGHPLNMRPDEFLAANKELIMCNSHGAMFDIASGVCVEGPCVGRKLVRLPIRIEAGLVLLDGDPDELRRLYA